MWTAFQLLQINTSQVVVIVAKLFFSLDLSLNNFFIIAILISDPKQAFDL